MLLRRYSAQIILTASSTLAVIGSIILSVTESGPVTIFALGLSGLGLAAAFPVVLGIIGDRFVKWSGTAFGIALTIALFGNMLINYLTGIVTESTGMSAYSWMLIITGICTTLLIIISFSRYKKK
jgi:MFS family permease